MAGVPPPPTTTIVPFAQLPACAAACGALYDANGACVPPEKPVADEAAYGACFCEFGALQPLKTAASGVCDLPCAGDPNGVPGIQSWFAGLCGVEVAQPTKSSAPGVDNARPGGSPYSGGGDWLSGHWQWVVGIVLIVVAIVASWVGACLWRRRYLKKKDRAYELGKALNKQNRSSAATASWGPGAAPPGLNGHSSLPGPVGGPQGQGPPGMFMAGASSGSGFYDEKAHQPREQRKWVVKDRT